METQQLDEMEEGGVLENKAESGEQANISLLLWQFWKMKLVEKWGLVYFSFFASENNFGEKSDILKNILFTILVGVLWASHHGSIHV